jgi:hypothetical protein
MAAYITRERRNVRARRVPLKTQTMLVCGLLFLNFPVAAFCLFSGIDLVGEYLVRITNDSGTTIDSFILQGPGVQMEAGPIRPGAITRHSLDFNSDGSLTFSARRGAQRFEGQIEGYVTGNGGGVATVRFTPEAEFAIHHDEPNPGWLSD